MNLSFYNKKILFLIIWIVLNILLMVINTFYFHYLYVVIFINPILAKLLMIFTILFIKIKNKLMKKKNKLKKYLNDLICLTVTCYCESFDEILKTLDSLDVSFEKSKKKSLIIVIFDGICKEENTNNYTWELLYQKMNKKYKTFSHDYKKNWKNYETKLDLYSGIYKNLNIIIVVKEKNLGKKDSLNFTRDYSINKLQEDISYNMDILVNDFSINRKDINIVGSMDADCEVNEDGILNLYNDILIENVMGVSGIVLPKTNIQKNFWYIIQLTEYYNTQYITRLCYSLLGKTTCLPGALNLFDMKYYNDKVRKNFQKIPKENELFKSLIALIGEDRRFTGLLLEYNDKKCKTLINKNTHIYTSLPDTLMRLTTQRRRWNTSSLLNNFIDMKNSKLNLLIKYNTFSTTLIAYFCLYALYVIIYMIALTPFNEKILTEFNIFPYENNTSYYYRVFIYFITFIIISFQLFFLKIMKNWKERLFYIIGLLFYMFIAIFLIVYLIFYAVIKLDNLKWGNIKQNKEVDEEVNKNDIIINIEK